MFGNFTLSFSRNYHEITTVGILHHNTEGLGGLVEEGLLVFDNIGSADRSQNSNLVKGVILILF